MSGLGDDDLWEILRISPHALKLQPTAEWTAWAKNEVLTHEGDYLSDFRFLPRLIRIGYFLTTYYDGDIFERGHLLSVFRDAWAASGVTPSEHSFNKMVRYGSEFNNVLKLERSTDQYNVATTRIKFTFAAKVGWFIGGQYPKSFDEIPYGLPAGTVGQAGPNTQQQQAQQQFNAMRANLSAVAAPVQIATSDAKVGDIRQEVTVNPLDLSPLAEAERVRQEHETKRLEMALAAVAGKRMDEKPTQHNREPDGFTIPEFTAFVAKSLGHGIDEGTARNILKRANILSIGQRMSSRGRPDIFPRAEAEKAGREYVDQEKRK